ncbi:hypothetical protein [Dysgonomonas macrotermitis]|uniref:Uncharacterized protein n=1 Tax=Dysgonomonas macrotermitis TaxID=1346286 RepID=A0A1M5GLN3_9BACT|nr:hypothetical protein [Dysgonomonas macrotermitis]SHG04634.1 hypothetical protein SAMN05444362_11457 [Dysgonomonas macrotermitis]
MADNENLGSLSFAINIDTSQLPDTIREIEKQLSTIGAVNNVDLSVDKTKLLEEIGKILYGQDFELNLSIDESYKKMIEDLKKQLAELRFPTVPTSQINESNRTIQNSINTQRRGMNMLQFEVQQVARELPSLSYGVHTFFAAISNNVPMLADQIRLARREYAELVAAGQRATPVWRQVVSSIFSWQTALVALLTVFTLFGKDIVSWIGGLFNARKENEKLAESLIKSQVAIYSEQRAIKALFDQLKDAKKGTAEWNTARDKIMSGYGKYLNGLDSETTSLNNIAAAYSAISAAALQAAKDRGIASAKQEAENEFAKEWKDSAPKIAKYLEQTKKYTQDQIQEFMRMVYTGELTKNNHGNLPSGMFLGVLMNEKSAYDDLIVARQEYAESIKDIDRAFNFGNGQIDKETESLIKNQERLLEQAKLLSESTEAEIITKNRKIKSIEAEITRLKQLGVEKVDKQAEDARIKQYEAEIDLVKQAYSDYKDYIEVVGELEAKKRVTAKYGDQFSQVFKKEANAIEYATDPLIYFAKVLDDLSKMTSKRDKGLRNAVSRLIGGTEAGDDIDAFRKEWETLGRDLNFEKEGYSILEKLAGSGIDVEAAKSKIKQLFRDMGISVKLEYNTFREAVEQTFRRIDPGVMSSEEGMKLRKSFLSEMNKNTFTDLLTAYQDYTSQRYSIEHKFDKDLKDLWRERYKAETEGNEAMVTAIDRAIAKATKSKGEALISFDFEQLKKTPSYVRAFENLQDTSTKTLNSLLQQLEQAKQTAAQVLTPDQLREYTNTTQSIIEELLNRDPFSRIAELKLEVVQADKDLLEAEKRLNEVMAGNDTTITAEQALSEYNAAKDESIKKTNQLKAAEKKVADTLSQLSRSIEDVGGSIGGVTGEIISLIGSISTTVFSAIDGMKSASTTASAAIQAIEKASVILAVISAAIQIATKIADLFGGESDTDKYEKAKAMYNSYISILDKVIQKQLEFAEVLAGENAAMAYDKAVELVEKQTDAARTLGKQYLNSGASKGFAGIGSKASKGTKEVEDMSSEGWTQAAKALGMSVQEFKNLMGSRMTGLFDLSIEQLEELSTEAPVFISQLDSDTQNYFDQIIKGTDKISEVMENLKETYTGLSFDTLKDGLDDLLQAADTTFSDVGDSFEDHMRNAVLNFVKNKYLINALEEWYAQFAKAYSDETLTSKEVEDLRKMWETAYNKGQDMYDTALQVAGISKESQESLSGLSKGIQGLTESTAQIIEAYLNTMRDVVISVHRVNEQQLTVLEASQLIQSNMLSELVLMNSTANAINNAVKSALARSSGEDGPGFRVFIKS